MTEMTAKYPAETIAQYFLACIDPETGDAMTNLKLQKLLYYAQAWHLAYFNQPLFRDKIEAWIHGPAIPKIYDQYKKYKADAIPLNDVVFPKIDNETDDFLKGIWKTYGSYSAKYLEQLTHNENPWKQTREGLNPGEPCTKEITLEAMREYYQKKLTPR